MQVAHKLSWENQPKIVSVVKQDCWMLYEMY